MARDMRIPALAVLAAFAVGFSLGVICQGRASDAGAVPIDPRIQGGSERQQLVADWLLKTRPDFAAVVTEVRFVPQQSLWVNSIRAAEHASRCFRDDDGKPLAEGRCIGEAQWPGGKVRFAREYNPGDVQLLLRALAHEYAHHVLYQNCGLCTDDESLADQCALDQNLCGRP